MLDQLTFDTTDANTIADSSNVGAYVRSSDGTLITHTTDGGKERLDVDAKITGDVNVTATDLDIRDLSSVTDSVTAIQGTDPWIIGDGGGSITVDATDLDIRDLNFATDSVTSRLQDGSGNALTSTAGALDVNIASGTLTTSDAALANTAIANASNDLGVADTAEDVVASPLANRKYLWIYNNGNRRIFVGSTGVTSTNGYPMSPRSEMMLRAGAAVDIEWVGPNTNQQIRTLELS